MKRAAPLAFFSKLRWLDGRPLLSVIESYRKRIFTEALATFDEDGAPRFTLVVTGRAKKNWKSADLIFAALYRLLAWPSPQGHECLLLANDEDQAGDDLTLAKKVVKANPVLERALRVKQRELERRDGEGSLLILPAKDVIGSHGKTYLFAGFDELHGHRNWDLLEALAPDPTRRDALVWITSYASIYNSPGAPLFDLVQKGKAGTDARMFFSWYAADYTTDTTVPETATPEERANPSMASWGHPGYLAQQQRRLPSHKYRRLHLNLPGMPEGTFFSPEKLLACVVPGRASLPPLPDVHYHAFVDMSGGSADDACLAIAHLGVDGRVVLDLVTNQGARVPFDPARAVERFAGICRDYRVGRAVADAYGGETFRRAFEAHGITYETCSRTTAALYELLEPAMNSAKVELLDVPKATEQLLALVVRGGKVTHLGSEHDDWATVTAGAAWLASREGASVAVAPIALRQRSYWTGRGHVVDEEPAAPPYVEQRNGARPIGYEADYDGRPLTAIGDALFLGPVGYQHARSRRGWPR